MVHRAQVFVLLTNFLDLAASVIRISFGVISPLSHTFRKPSLSNRSDYYIVIRSRYKVTRSCYKVTRSRYKVISSRYKVTRSRYKLTRSRYKLTRSCYRVTRSRYKVTRSRYKVTRSCYKVTRSCYKVTRSRYLITKGKPSFFNVTVFTTCTLLLDSTWFAKSDSKICLLFSYICQYSKSRY
jgi:hypothetical protein